MIRSFETVLAAKGMVTRASAIAVALVASRCHAIVGYEETHAQASPVDAGERACALNSDCTPEELCPLGHCAARCEKGADCPALERCLLTAFGGACVAAETGPCPAHCPMGTACVEGACRASCDADSEGSCLEGQHCRDLGCYEDDPSRESAPQGGAP